MLSKDEVAQIVDALRASNSLVGPQSEFYIAPKDHYDQHQRIDRILDMFESTASVIGKTVLVFFVVGVIGLVALGLKFKQ